MAKADSIALVFIRSYDGLNFCPIWTGFNDLMRVTPALCGREPLTSPTSVISINASFIFCSVATFFPIARIPIFHISKFLSLKSRALESACQCVHSAFRTGALVEGRKDPSGDAKEVGQWMPAEETCATRTTLVISACGGTFHAETACPRQFAATFSKSGLTRVSAGHEFNLRR